MAYPTKTNEYTYTKNFYEINSCGLYYKHITIVNNDSRVTLQTVASLTSVIDKTS